jgi:hypothetical protein
MEALQPVRFSSEAEDLQTILAYLAIRQSSAEAQRITGLSKSAISEILAGRRRRETARRVHIAVVANVVRDLMSARKAATGSEARGKSAIGWLYASTVETSRGRRSALEVLSDPVLAIEALDQLRRG